MGSDVFAINRRLFEELCEILCEPCEICSFFKCTGEDIDHWCIEEYGYSFSIIFERYRTLGLKELENRINMPKKRR